MIEVKRQGAVDVIVSDQPLIADQMLAISERTEPCLRGRQPHLVIDLQRVPLMDSRGLEWLLDTHRTCLHRGGNLKLVNATPLCQDILHVTGIADEIELFETVAAAIGSYGR